MYSNLVSWRKVLIYPSSLVKKSLGSLRPIRVSLTAVTGFHERLIMAALYHTKMLFSKHAWPI